jgi:hypothetical protein
VRCKGCGRSVRLTTRKRGSVDVKAMVGRVLTPGDAIEVRLTRRRDRSGRFRFGAAGRIYTYRMRSNGLGPRVDRCTRPGSNKRMRCPT